MARSTQQEISFEWDGLALAGTLHLPSGSGPHPAVLMMQGSGPADRDSGGYFLPIREAFLARGIAAYSFDKPGIGSSGGDWRDYDFEGRAAQAVAALETMRAHQTLDARRVGIWGHSQGGWLAQLLASRMPDLLFAIANSGPSIDVVRQDAYGCEHSMRAAGRSEEHIRQALTFYDSVHAAALRGDDFATVDARLLGPARRQPWYGYLEIDDERMWNFLRRTISEQYEPLEALAKVRCPFLAVYGALDPLLPAWQSAEESGRALHEAGNPDATIVVFPRGDHRIQDAHTGEFAIGYLDLTAGWAARRARLA
jgi:dipeptidyl aminopeptidase/acylaminoacyl peptidase